MVKTCGNKKFSYVFVCLEVLKKGVLDMSVNFSTITPMSQSTISRTPAYSTAAAPATQPAASSPMDGYQQPKKKSHWFRNTLLTAIVLVGGATALRGKVGMFKDFNAATPLANDAKLMEKAAHYGKKGVAVVGDYVMKYASEAWNFVTSKFAKYTSKA